MNYIREGSGAPLVLIHGISNAHNWDPVIPALAQEREVVAIDLPGFGRSAPLSDEVTIASLTDAVQEFLVEQGIRDADVVGSSMGARIALEMARRGHRGNVVALAPGGFWTDRQLTVFGATIRSSIALVRRITPLLPVLARSKIGRSALLLQFSAAPWRLDADLVLQELRGFTTYPALDAALDTLVHGPKQRGAPAGSLRGRVAIGWGRNDRVTPPSQASRAQQLFPDASLHWFDDCGHFPHWDQPEHAVQLIRSATTARARK